MQSALAVVATRDEEDRRLIAGDLKKSVRRRASDGDVPTVVDPDLNTSQAAISERKRQAATIIRRTIDASWAWLWERCVRELGFWWLVKRMLGFIFSTLFTLALIPILVPTKHSALVARFIDPVSVGFCSIPVNHYLCPVICVTPQSANVFTSTCGETSPPQDLCQLMVDTNEQLTLGVNHSSYLHPLPNQLRGLRGAAERMSERLQWQLESTSYKVPKSTSISDRLDHFIVASQRTPSKIKRYLIALDTAIEIFMIHNSYAFEDFKVAVLARQGSRFPWLMSLLGVTGQNVLKALELQLGPFNNEQELQERINNHLEALSTCLSDLWKLGEELMEKVEKLLSMASGIRNLLESAQSSIQVERQQKYRKLDIKVRFAIAYLYSPEPDELDAIKNGLDLVQESIDFFDQAKSFLETILDSFENVQILLDNMRSELNRSGFRFSHWESPERINQSLLAMNRSAMGLRVSKQAFDRARLLDLTA